ncbi:hypothetical protein [Flavobacterium sp.]|uniref:hypothetical protein n=1 Tax=Flavobacterium sp. TaxID=239 RepID=UPI00374FE0CF
MKKLLILSIASIFLSNCTTDEIMSNPAVKSESPMVVVENNSAELNNNIAAKTINASTVVTISTITRGFSSSISINNGYMTRNSSGVVQPTTVKMNTAKWITFKQKFSALNLVKVSSYEPSTCLRCSGADLAQTLEISYNGVIYTSQEFDKTNPPTALKNFVSYMNSLN